MKVFFDSKISSIQLYGGISRMVFELLRHLNKYQDLEKFFYRGLYEDQYPYKKEWFKKYYAIKKPSFFDRRLVNFLDDTGSKIAYALNNAKGMIYHSFYHRIPKNKKGPLVVHVYDMIQEMFYNMPKATEFKKNSFDAADIIIAISESTKKDLCKLYPINPNKVIVAHLGVNEIFFFAKDGQTSDWKHNNTAKSFDFVQGKRPYMMYVGGRNYEYKNFDLLLNTFINKKYFLDFDLVLVGGEKEIVPEQKEKVKKTTLGGNWLVQKFGDDQMLIDLYKNASVFVYPSLYEGFGIPLLEAMAAGCPVVACNSSSLSEVVGDAGLLFNPKDPNDLSVKIDKIISDPKTTRTLIEKGKIRAKQFTWDAMADKIYQAYSILL